MLACLLSTSCVYPDMSFSAACQHSPDVPQAKSSKSRLHMFFCFPVLPQCGENVVCSKIDDSHSSYSNIAQLLTCAADEVDSLLAKRRATDHEATSLMRTEFMQLWDGFCTDSQANVMILAATNRPWELDEAVLRRYIYPHPFCSLSQTQLVSSRKKQTALPDLPEQNLTSMHSLSRPSIRYPLMHDFSATVILWINMLFYTNVIQYRILSPFFVILQVQPPSIWTPLLSTHVCISFWSSFSSLAKKLATKQVWGQVGGWDAWRKTEGSYSEAHTQPASWREQLLPRKCFCRRKACQGKHWSTYLSFTIWTSPPTIST